MKTSFQRLAILAVVLFLQSAAWAAGSSVAGIWKWKVQGTQGGEGLEQTLKLEEKDGKIVGMIVGRHGGQFSVPDTVISNAKLIAGVLTFSVTREFNGRSFTTKYEGKLEGDTITGTYERPGFGGGEAVKSEWRAKRQKPTGA